MYALQVELAPNEMSSDYPVFEPTMHVDVGVQVEESDLDHRRSPVLPPPLSGIECLVHSDDAELANIGMHQGATSGSVRGKDSSSHPRKSGGASPWLVGDYVEEEDGEEGCGEEEVDNCSEEGISRPSEPYPALELEKIGFIAGHPNGELQVGTVARARAVASPSNRCHCQQHEVLVLTPPVPQVR